MEKNITVRSTTLKALALMNFPEVIPLLAKGIEDDNILIKENAITALGHYGKEAIPFIVDAISKEHHYFCYQLFDSLVEIGRESVPALIGFTGSDDYNIRQKAFSSLGEIGGTDVTNFLFTFFWDKEKSILDRFSAATAIGISKDRRVEKKLIKFLKTKLSYLETIAALIALFGIGNDGAGKWLYGKLETGFSDVDIDLDLNLRFFIASGLFTLKDIDGIPYLENFCSTLEQHKSKENDEKRKVIASGIDTLNSLIALEKEKELSDEERWNRIKSRYQKKKRNLMNLLLPKHD